MHRDLLAAHEKTTNEMFLFFIFYSIHSNLVGGTSGIAVIYGVNIDFKH